MISCRSGSSYECGDFWLLANEEKKKALTPGENLVLNWLVGSYGSWSSDATQQLYRQASDEPVDTELMKRSHLSPSLSENLWPPEGTEQRNTLNSMWG